MACLCISGVQLSPKWHIDNGIHSLCIGTKGEAFLIIDKQHIFTLPHFKVISPSSCTERLQWEDVPINDYRRTCLFRKARQQKTLPVPAEAINLFDLTFSTHPACDGSFCAARPRFIHRGGLRSPTLNVEVWRLIHQPGEGLLLQFVPKVPKHLTQVVIS